MASDPDRLVARVTLVVKPGEEEQLVAATARLAERAAERVREQAREPAGHRRLPPHAAEILIPVRALGQAREMVRSAVAGLAVDHAVRPAAQQPCRLLISDMDSTLIAAECIDELAALAGVGEKVRAVTERAMRGALDFAGALRERVALLAGLPATALMDVARRHAPLRPGARTLFATLKAEGVFTVIVSGGFTPIVRHVASLLGADAWHANELETKDGRLTGRVLGPIVDAAAKAGFLHEHGSRLGLEPQGWAALGDGANDLLMLQAAGLAVGVHPKPLVAEHAHGVIRHTDLTSVLLYLGIPPARWVVRA